VDRGQADTDVARTDRLRGRFEDRLAPWRRTIRYHGGRAAIKVVVGAYLRVRLIDRDGWPSSPAVLCFNHLSWVDPFLLYAVAPGQPRLYLYGPKESDLGEGRRNRLIRWFGTAVPFEPGKRDMLASTRRTMRVLGAGHLLGIAGEGGLSEDEGVVLPVNPGVAFFALRAGVPIVPIAIAGSRWLRFGKRVDVRVGLPILTEGLDSSRATIAALTEEVHAALAALVLPPAESRVPGPFGRWLTDVFADRPWRHAREPEAAADRNPGAR
jgi:1-acyl-sn-glycerol-3-phosphate acyltransferase